MGAASFVFSDNVHVCARVCMCTSSYMHAFVCEYMHKCVSVCVVQHLNGGCVDVKLLEDGESLFIEFTADTDVGNVWSIIVI